VIIPNPITEQELQSYQINRHVSFHLWEFDLLDALDVVYRKKAMEKINQK